MDEQGRLTIEDGQKYIDFVERWGETPQHKKLVSCRVCGKVYDHELACYNKEQLLHRDELAPRDENRG